ncbi:MAG: AlkZ family DNA glycosylase [Thermoleophilia bacterium]|nr:AlkZ family DNA glycosylase [Thermoleophilia bacterium]
MADRVLTLRELNRALLARQLLLRRARLPVARAVERVGALQAQWPPSPYVALWSRLERFARDDLDRAVRRRRLVKATLMRVTLHLVSTADYLAFAGLIRDARRRAMERRAERDGVVADVDGLVPRLLEVASREPRSRPELLRLLGLPSLRVDDPRPWVVWHLLVARAELVHSPESSAWREHTSGGRFVPARSWLGGEGATGDAAATALVRRYLGAFGPATRADAAQWTGLALGALEPGFARLPLRRFLDERGRELYDLPRAPLPAADTVAPVRFLPLWDSALLAHDDRTRILPERYRGVVIQRNGTVRQTFLVDGFVAGTWRLERGRIALEPFEPLPARVRRDLEEEAARLAAFHA